MTQSQVRQKIHPLLQSQGQLYEKHKQIWARRAKVGECIITTTSDGEETQNKADRNDMVVMNQTEAKEEYIMSRKKFKNRYTYIRRAKGPYNLYRSFGKVIGVELTEEVLEQLGWDDTFHFEAPWGASMIAKKGDFMVTPTDTEEVYRIARKEFLETYKPK